MNASKTTGVISLLVWISISAQMVFANPVVQVTGGDIRGQLLPEGGASFKGVPFVAPPVGDLRWREPQPVEPWEGVLDATSFGPACTQRIADWNIQEAQGNQEDCLTINIWTPEWPIQSPKAVMVWLYGGGNWGGGSSVDYMDGADLSREDIVFVSLNYRVGVFGFFAHPGLTAESPNNSSGNYGLLDQLAGLQWVQDNIAQFGGDPSRVTLFGQSAGAIDTSYLASSPLSKGLIHRTIQQSGPPIRPIEKLDSAEAQGVKFAASIDAPEDPAAAIEYLRSLSGPELHQAAEAVRRDLEVAPTIDPIIDGYLITRLPADIFQDGDELPIPMIIGNNVHEHPRGYDRDDILGVIDWNFLEEFEPQVMAFYGLDKSELGNAYPQLGPAGDQVSADTRHRCGAVAQSIWRSSNGRVNYQYEFDPPVAGEELTRHQAEIGFVFGNLLDYGYLGGTYTENDQKISDEIQVYWTNFAKTGNPNKPDLRGLPEWPQSTPDERPYMKFAMTGPQVRQGLRREICDLYIQSLEETLPAGTAASRPE